MTKKEFLKQLYTTHNLVEEDVYLMNRKDKKTGKMKQIPIITRSGIEKVQNQNNIKVAFETIYCDLDGAVLKATSMRFDSNMVLKIALSQVSDVFDSPTFVLD